MKTVECAKEEAQFVTYRGRTYGMFELAFITTTAGGNPDLVIYPYGELAEKIVVSSSAFDECGVKFLQRVMRRTQFESIVVESAIEPNVTIKQIDSTIDGLSVFDVGTKVRVTVEEI